MIEELPPQDMFAEQALIGSCLCCKDGRAIDVAMGILEPRDCYFGKHQRMLDSLFRLREEGYTAFDAVTLGDALRTAGELDEIGGHAYILECMGKAPIAAHIAYYCQIVKQLSIRRRAITNAHQLLLDLHNPTKDSETVLQTALVTLSDLSESQSIKISTGIANEIENIASSFLDPTQRIRRVATGVRSIDELIEGLPKQGLTYIGARPSAGKTAFACGLAVRIAESGNPVLFITIEQTSFEIVERFLSLHSGISLKRIQQLQLQPSENEQLVDSMQQLRVLPIVLNEYQTTQTGILSLIRQHQRTHGTEVVIIDYLSLIEPDDIRIPREQQIARISRSLKGVAKATDTAVVVLCQLNRDFDKRGGKPRLSDLRESGSIEQDGDLIFLVHRPNADLGSGRPEDILGEDNVGIIQIAKNRNGPRGEIELRWDGRIMRYSAKPSFTDDSVYDVQSGQIGFQ